MATVITIASHVEAFDGSQYKRSLSSSSTPSVPAKRLSRPNSELTLPAQFPATTARPDQRVNVRVPVSRACYSRLLPGQVAFVNRQFGKFHPSAKSGLGGLTPVASMEEVNDMLAQEHNFLSASPESATIKDFLFKEVETSSVYNHDGKNRKKATAMVFKDVNIDAQHPVMQFALDGLVATRVEEVDDLNTYSSASAQQACIVAVKGPAPMRLAPVPRETHTGMRESMMGTRIPAENVFLEPTRILAKVYVALVAVFVNVESNNRRVKLRYEVVSSSNLDVDPVFATGRKLFRDELLYALEDDTNLAAGNRIVLRVSELGSVVDTAFGPAEQPQLTVCVHVAPLERVTITKQRHSPVAPYALFAKMSRVQLRKNRQDLLDVTGPSRLYRTDPTGKLSVLGARPFITGAPSDADFEKLSSAVIAMQTSMDTFVSKLQENSENLVLIKEFIQHHVSSPELEQEPPHQEESGADFFQGIESLEDLKGILAGVLSGGDDERSAQLAELGKHIIEFYKQQNGYNEPYTSFVDTSGAANGRTSG